MLGTRSSLKNFYLGIKHILEHSNLKTALREKQTANHGRSVIFLLCISEITESQPREWLC
jgi:hypothetical protein